MSPSKAHDDSLEEPILAEVATLAPPIPSQQGGAPGDTDHSDDLGDTIVEGPLCEQCGAGPVNPDT